jgi:hypothetical protein
MNFKYSLTDYGKGVYALSFDNRYDLAMSFLRSQEFYESESNQFKGKMFSLLDYIEWYAKKNNNKFTYAADWSGFNVPSIVLHQVYNDNIPDMNKYDYFMKGVYDYINRLEKCKYYLIGIKCGEWDVFEHEYAHALFYLDEKYKEEQLSNMSNLENLDKLVKTVEDMGYSGDTTLDEVQAYMATSELEKKFKDVLGKKAESLRKPFKETFGRFT